MWPVPSIESHLCWSSVTTTNQCLSMIPYLLLMPLILSALEIFTARKRSLQRLCFYRCLSVHGGGVRGCSGGACVVALRGHVWLLPGGMHGCSGGACVVKGGMHGKGGHAWQRGVCMARGACMVKGGMRGGWGVIMCGEGGALWRGMHVWRRGACMMKGGMRGKGGCAWWRGACVARGACMACTPPWDTAGHCVGGMHPTRMHSCSMLFYSFVVFVVCIRRIYAVQQGWLWKKTPGSTNLAMFMVFNACGQQSNQIGIIKFSLTCPKQIHASWQVPKLYFIRCLAPLLVKQPCFSIWTGFSGEIFGDFVIKFWYGFRRPIVLPK